MTDWTGKPFTEAEKASELTRYHTDKLRASIERLKAYRQQLKDIQFNKDIKKKD
jgi:hypothetical protein